MFVKCTPLDLGCHWSIGALDGFSRVMMERFVVQLNEKYTPRALGLVG